MNRAVSANIRSNSNIVRRLWELDVINANDVLQSFGLSAFSLWLCGSIVLPIAHLFSSQILRYDLLIDQVGHKEASRRFLIDYCYGPVHESGFEHLPASGPCIFVSNHPGLLDAMVIFSALPAGNLLTVARDRDFLRALPAIKNRLLLFPKEGESGSQKSLRELVRHLRSGSSVLIFPAGATEPDPAFDPAGAVASVRTWSKSVDFFTRLVPEAKVVPVLVSGVFHPRALNHPIAKMRLSAGDRNFIASSLQISTRVIFRDKWRVKPRFRILPPVEHGRAVDLVTQLQERYQKALFEKDGKCASEF